MFLILESAGKSNIFSLMQVFIYFQTLKYLTICGYKSMNFHNKFFQLNTDITYLSIVFFYLSKF